MSVSPIGASSALAYAFASTSRSEAATASATGRVGLSTSDLRLVSELKARDRVVRAHEMAHMAAGAGIVTQGASFSYQTGPDGQRYAVGGEVGISTSPGRTQEETLAKASQIRAAALAPADPSAQDLRVAAEATQMAAAARQELVAASGSAEEGRVGAAYGGVAAPGAPPGRQVDVWA